MTPPTDTAPTPLAVGRSLGRTAAVLVILAMGLSIASSVVVGLGLGPVQYRRETGSVADGDGLLEAVYLGLASAQLVWLALATAGLVLGIVAAVRDRGRMPGVVAIVVAVLGPVASFAVFTGLAVVSLPGA
jgi:hypothetical protein